MQAVKIGDGLVPTAFRTGGGKLDNPLLAAAFDEEFGHRGCGGVAIEIVVPDRRGLKERLQSGPVTGMPGDQRARICRWCSLRMSSSAWLAMPSEAQAGSESG